MNPKLIIEWLIEDKPDVVRVKKWQLRPLTGWPEGIDPFPNLQDDDIAQERRYESPRHMEGKSLESVKAGDKFKFQDAEWYVTESAGNERGQSKFKAVEVLPIQSVSQPVAG